MVILILQVFVLAAIGFGEEINCQCFQLVIF